MSAGKQIQMQMYCFITETIFKSGAIKQAQHLFHSLELHVLTMHTNIAES